MSRARWILVAVAFFALSHPIIELACTLGACASKAEVGLKIDAPSGLVKSVVPGSAAANAGLRAGDRVDFARTGPTMHLWLWDGDFLVGRPFVLPIDRNGATFTATIVARKPPLDAGDLAFDVVALAFAVIILTMACVVIFRRLDFLTIAFFAFCLFFVTTDNTTWLRISPPALMPITALESVFPVLASTVGFLYLCLRFPTGKPAGRWHTVDRCVPAFGAILGLVYYLHFYEAAFLTGKTSSLYVATSALSVLSAIVGFVAYLTRFWGASGPQLTRMRWVAAAIFIYIVSLLLFFADQLVNTTATPWIIWLFSFNPAGFAFAYALVKERVIDIRIVGARAIIYAAITSVPVALLAFADWFFARRLEDARLATVFEIAIAIGFSFWLQALHRRIDRFAERVFFASRHRSFERMHHMMRALPFTEKVSTIESMLAEETAQTMQFSSAAIFRAANGVYERAASVGWDGAASALDADDPLVLFARSERRGVQLAVTPPSKAPLPAGEAHPVYALPVVAGRRTIAVVLYGSHRDGEAIDAEEEQLLGGLAHAAATAYEHLHAEERERENATLRAALREYGVNS